MSGKRPANYSTRQGMYILDYMRSLGGMHVTVTQLVRRFSDEAAGIGQATIYRHLERLAAEGRIRKFVLSDGRSACYQYVDGAAGCREHFHLICETCGSLIHMDCGLLDEIEVHLRKKHDFKINILKTVFYGTCKKCLSGERRPMR